MYDVAKAIEVLTGEYEKERARGMDPAYTEALGKALEALHHVAECHSGVVPAVQFRLAGRV